MMKLITVLVILSVFSGCGGGKTKGVPKAGSDELRRRAELLTGIQFDRPVEIHFLTYEEYKEHMGDLSLEALNEKKFWSLWMWSINPPRDLLQRFGGEWAEDMCDDIDSFRMNRFSLATHDMMDYDEEKEVIYVWSSDRSDSEIFGVFLSALMERRFDFEARTRDARTADERIAIGMFRGLYQSFIQDRYDSEIRATPKTENVDASAFLSELFRRGGMPEVNRVAENPPKSTELLQHVEDYIAQSNNPIDLESSVPNLLETNGWTLSQHEVVGESRIQALGPFLNEPFDKVGAPDGWGGDLYHVYTHPENELGLICWWTTWDTEEDAKQFRDFLVALKESAGVELKRSSQEKRDIHEAKLPDRRTSIEFESTHVVVIDGPTKNAPELEELRNWAWRFDVTTQ